MTGSVTVDYTNKSISDNYKVNIPGNGSQDVSTYSIEAVVSDGNGGFTVTDPAGLVLTYTGEQPFSANTLSVGSGADKYTSNGAAPLISAVTTTPPAPCFATGTTITTEDGPIAVEHLAVGDMALTTSGIYSKVRWIGHRTVDCARHPRQDLVMPIRISAQAFGADAPARDLVVSPGHSICVNVGGEEMLIPAGSLVNGTSVVRDVVETVTYWHVELEAHDILFAENLPCESYLDMGSRGFFAESGLVDLVALPDAAVRTHADFCRPFHASGAIVDAVRRRLDARVGSAPAAARAAA